MVTSDSKEGHLPKVELKYASMAPGGLSVMTFGEWMMLKWLALSSGSSEKVPHLLLLDSPMELVRSGWMMSSVVALRLDS